MTQRHRLSYKESFCLHPDEMGSLDRWMRKQCRDHRHWRQPGLGLPLALPLLWGSASFSVSQICFLIDKMGFQERMSQGAQEA